MSYATVGQPGSQDLTNAPVGLSITARLVDGDETLPTVVTVAPVLDEAGDPLRAYRASWAVTPALPVECEWLLDGVFLTSEPVLAGAESAPTADQTDLELFRLYLDDVPGDLFSDGQVAVFLEQYGDVRLAVAAAADLLAVRFSGGIRKFTTDGQSFERGSRAESYADLAKRMRAAAGSGEVPAYNVTVDLCDFGVTLSGAQLPRWTSLGC